MSLSNFPSVEGVWIFSGTAQLNLPVLFMVNFFVKKSFFAICLRLSKCF